MEARFCFSRRRPHKVSTYNLNWSGESYKIKCNFNNTRNCININIIFVCFGSLCCFINIVFLPRWWEWDVRAMKAGPTPLRLVPYTLVHPDSSHRSPIPIHLTRGPPARAEAAGWPAWTTWQSLLRTECHVVKLSCCYIMRRLLQQAAKAELFSYSRGVNTVSSRGHQVVPLTQTGPVWGGQGSLCEPNQNLGHKASLLVLSFCQLERDRSTSSHAAFKHTSLTNKPVFLARRVFNVSFISPDPSESINKVK